MIWLTWRQFRTQAIIAGVILVAAVVALTVNGQVINGLWADSGAASCPATGTCAELVTFKAAVQSHALVLFVLGSALMYLVPPLIGVFWGAPLVARELETGTHRLAWNQSVTRDHWLGVKLAVLGGGSMVFAGVLSLVVWWSSYHVDQAGMERIGPLLFGARGIVPIGYAAFAFVLGVTLGIVFRRTVPAMAATIGVYAAAAGAMVLWGRAHLLPATHVTRALATVGPDTIDHFGWGTDGRMDLVAKANVPGAWILHNDTITSTGGVFTGPADPVQCARDAPPKSCEHWVSGLGLRQTLVYQPANHFWGLQWAETGLFLALAVLLAGFGFWWLRRRAG